MLNRNVPMEHNCVNSECKEPIRITLGQYIERGFFNCPKCSTTFNWGGAGESIPEVLERFVKHQLENQGWKIVS